MTVTHGLDPARVREISRSLATQADRLETVRSSGADSLGVLQVAWEGDDLGSYAEGWRMLGRSLLVSGRATEAVAAYEKASSLTGGKDPNVELDLAEALGIPLTPVNDVPAAREELASRMERTSLPGGGVLATPAAFLGLPGLRRPHAPAPALGADTFRVLHEMGFSVEEIAAVAG